jgi:hypothetical protein
MSEPITPDEVRRLRLESGDRLIVRTADTRLASEQISHHQENLQAHFPDNEVLVIVADEIAVELATPKPQRIAIRGPLMTEADVDKFVERVGRQLAQRILPQGGLKISRRDEAAADAEYIQRAMLSPEEIHELRHPSDDDPDDDGLAGVPARR